MSVMRSSRKAAPLPPPPPQHPVVDQSLGDALNEMIASGVRVITRKIANPSQPYKDLIHTNSLSSIPSIYKPRSRFLKTKIILDSDDDPIESDTNDTINQTYPKHSKRSNPSRKRHKKVRFSEEDPEVMPRCSPEDLDTAVLGKEFANFPTQVDAAEILRVHMQEYYEDQFETVSDILAANKSSLSGYNRPNPHGNEDPFASLEPIEGEGSLQQIYSTQCHAGKKARKTKTAVTSYKPSFDAVPDYTHYTTSSGSILGHNDTELRYYPELLDEQATERLEHDLNKYYKDRNPDTRREHLPEVAKIRQIKHYLAKFVAEMGVTFQDLMSYVLEPNLKFREGMPQTLRRFWDDRQQFASKQLPKEDLELGKALSALPQSTPRKLALGCLCCKVIKDVCHVRIWPGIEMALLADASAERRDRDGDVITQSSVQVHDILQCAVCLQHNCAQHGDLQELSDDSEDMRSVKSQPQGEKACVGEASYRSRVVQDARGSSRKRKMLSSTFMSIIDESSSQRSDGSIRNSPEVEDLTCALPDTYLCSHHCFWLNDQRKWAGLGGDWSNDEDELLRTCLPSASTDKRGPCVLSKAFPHKTCAQVYQRSKQMAAEIGLDEAVAAISKPPSKRRKLEPKSRKVDPKSIELSGKPASRGVFYPCNHEGTCEQAECTCFKTKVHCEKSCTCSQKCGRRFKGCDCKAAGDVCADVEKCACLQWNRECDPDLCGRCGADIILDPNNRSDPNIGQDKCVNVPFQRSLSKRTLIGNSTVVPNGYGLYAGENIQAEELIGEYVGEILGNDECNRRGEHYHVTKNYLFRINNGHEIDGNFVANKLRIINNASAPQFQNCYCRYKIVNGIVKVGIFAKQDIKPGEELLYDYGYVEYEHLKNFREKDGSSSFEWVQKMLDEHRAAGTLEGVMPDTDRTATKMQVEEGHYTKGAPIASASQQA